MPHHVSGAIRCKDAEDLEDLEDSEERKLNNLRVFNAGSGFESLSLRHILIMAVANIGNLRVLNFHVGDNNSPAKRLGTALYGIIPPCLLRNQPR
jgi:hypothetical protein